MLTWSRIETGRRPAAVPLWIAAGMAGLVGVAGCGGSNHGSQPIVLSEGPVTPTGTAPSPTDGLGEATSPAAPTPTATAGATVRPAKATVTRTVPATSGSTSTAKATTTTSSAAVTVARVVAAERSALAGASTVHVTGTVVSGGKKYTIDAKVGSDTVAVLGYDSGTITVRTVGADLYLLADQAFFTAHGHPELGPQFDGQWMPIKPTDGAYPHIMQLAKISTWTALLASAPATRAAAGPTVDGVATTALTGGSGGTANTLLVPASGAALPLRADSADGKDSMQFRSWNAAVAANATPTSTKHEPADDLVDVPAFAEDSVVAFSSLWPS